MHTQKSENPTKPDIVRIVRDHLELSTQDLPRWLGLLDDAIVIEFPYGESAGNAPRLEGKAAIAEAINAFLLRVPGFRFNHPVVYPGADPDEAFATYDAEVLVPENGRVYQQKYIGHFRQRAGKLTYIAEYYDPTKLIEAFGI